MPHCRPPHERIDLFRYTPCRNEPTSPSERGPQEGPRTIIHFIQCRVLHTFLLLDGSPKQREYKQKIHAIRHLSVVNYSIFTPRRKEAESRSFWDTDRVVKKALDIDFGRMLKEDRILKLMAKCDNAVVGGEKTVAESLEEVRERREGCVHSHPTFVPFLWPRARNDIGGVETRARPLPCAPCLRQYLTRDPSPGHFSKNFPCPKPTVGCEVRSFWKSGFFRTMLSRLHIFMAC